VRLLELDRETRAGEGGTFSFARVPAGRYHLIAGLIGYAAQTNEVEVSGETTSTSFVLTASAIPMDEVVVSATPVPRPADEMFLSSESKTRVELLASPGATFAEKLSDIPGVNVRSLGPAPSRPVLRGLSDNRVLVLENGLRMGDLATFDPAHATPVEAIGLRQVDVVRGPASILYGPSTIGGVVNLISDIVPGVADRKISGVATLEGNTGSDLYSGALSTVWSGQKTAFSIKGGGVHAQDVGIPSKIYVDPATGTPFELERMPHSFDRSYEGGAGFAYQGETKTFGIGGRLVSLNYGVTGVPPNDDFANVPPSTARITEKRATVELRGGLGALSRRWTFEGAFNGYEHREYPTFQDSTGAVFEKKEAEFEKQTGNMRLQRRHSSGKLEGAIGAWADLENQKIEGEEPLGPTSASTGLAGYAFEEYKLNLETRLQGGLRFDYNKVHAKPTELEQEEDPSETPDTTFLHIDETRDWTAVTGSLGVLHEFGHLTGTFSIGRSFRAPTVQELFADGKDDPSGTFTIGDDTMGPETGFGIDASIKGSYSKVRFEISPYATFIKDYIYGFLTGDTLENLPVRQFSATDAQLFGYEASVTVEVAPHVALGAASDYVHAQDTNSDQPLPFTPPLRGLLRASYSSDRWNGVLDWRLVAEQARLGQGDTPTAGYGLLNAGIGLRRAGGHRVHDLRLSCDNVFDRDIRDHLSVTKDFLPMPGRTLRLDYVLSY
jgi:iron complex outermembrane receptor protein